ncbi:hypothetical protein CDL35_22030 [Escherichia coli]|nr:hypothetical protein CDL35_22030 [Escherichia coli]
MTDFGGKTSIFSHPVYLFLRKFSLQDSRGGSNSQNFTLKPNDETSSYNDAEDDPGENNGIYNPDYPNANGRTTTQDLKFQATLKRDGNATVKPGGFKATSTFQVTYE